MADLTPTLDAMLDEARVAFRGAALPDPAGDARALVGGLMAFSAAELISKGRDVMGEDDARRLRAAVERRCGGEPVHRILGFREFYGLKLYLSRDTLEPRADTEILVDATAPFLSRASLVKERVRLLDLGTGTGAICLALLTECPALQAVGADISSDALATARRNAEENHLGDRFETAQSNWFSAVAGRFDVIVSNPPYIPSADIETLQPEVKLFDPLAALDGGRDGLTAYRAIAAHALDHLERGGVVAVEIGYDQHLAVGAIFEQAGFEMIDARKDYGGNDRVMIFAPRG